jgi:hypothetical protein
MVRHTLRGRVAAQETKRLIVDDGQLNVGHRVVEFVVWATGIDSSEDPECILGKASDMSSEWDASDNRQIGWAGQTTSSTSRIMGFNLLDPDNIVIQDLFIYNRADIESANYLVVIEPVSLTDDEAVLQLIKERGQDDIR